MSCEGDNNPEPEIGQALRSAGRRPEPPREALLSVRSAVEAQWREVLALRSQRRRWARIGVSVAAAVVLAAGGLWLYVSPQTAGEKMAEVSIAVGSVQQKNGTWGRWQPVTRNQPLWVGAVVATASDGRAALQLADALSLRLDHDTRVVLTDARHVTIESGAVYLDSGVTLQPETERLQIMTPAGGIRHVGTQYQARVATVGVSIAVREGRIELSPAAGATQRAAAGEQMMVSPAGTVQRSRISPYDASWDWAAATAPEFNIDGRPLAEFLAWVGRELGRRVMFASPESEAEASRVLLSGSIAGLAPEDALTAVLPTTPLRGELRDGQLLVSINSAR